MAEAVIVATARTPIGKAYRGARAIIANRGLVVLGVSRIPVHRKPDR